MNAPTVEAIKDAIAQFPKAEKVSLSAWLSLETTDTWDRQMARDLAPGGRGAKFLKQANREMADAARKGTLEPLEKGFALRRKRS